MSISRWSDASVSLTERIQARLFAAKSLDLSDQKVLRTVLDPLVQEFDNLSGEEKTELFIILAAGLLTWIDQLARHPERLKTSELKPPRYVT